MRCHVIILGTTGMAYTFYEREKRKETKKKQKQRTETGAHAEYFHDTPHVELFNLGPPDRGGGTCYRPLPLHLNKISIQNRNQGTIESRPPLLDTKPSTILYYYCEAATTDL